MKIVVWNYKMALARKRQPKKFFHRAFESLLNNI